MSAEVFERTRFILINYLLELINKFFRSSGANKSSANLDYLDMEDPPNYDDFMYLRWQENTPPSSKGTPPPPYNKILSPGSSSNYINMFDKLRIRNRA